MPDHNPLWIEEPDYASKYGRGVAAGIQAGLIDGHRPLTLSPAYNRGWDAGFRAASRPRRERRAAERERTYQVLMTKFRIEREIQLEARIAMMVRDPRKTFRLFLGGVA